LWRRSAAIARYRQRQQQQRPLCKEQRTGLARPVTSTSSSEPT
jgi:hypothetical protein